jgi:hypothetical protein
LQATLFLALSATDAPPAAAVDPAAGTGALDEPFAPEPVFVAELEQAASPATKSAQSETCGRIGIVLPPRDVLPELFAAR